MLHSSRSIAGWLSACFSLFLLSGCATYMNKNKLELGIETVPPRAKVFLDINKEHICVTPCVYKVDKGGTHRLQIKWGSAPPKHVEVKRQVHPGFWFNFFFGPGVLIAMPIDMLTGSVFRPNYKGILAQFDPNFKVEEEEEEEEVELQGYQRLPDTPELRRVKEQYPEDVMRDQITQYYGAQKDEESYFRMIDRIYLIMIDMNRAGERLDSDEAIRRDHFRQPQR